MEIYEKIRYYREHTDFSQRNVAKILGISRNTVKKYWEGRTVPWERKPGSGRKNDIITDEVTTAVCPSAEDKQFCMDHILPKMLIGGFVTVTIGSVVLAGTIAQMILNSGPQ